MIDYKNLRVVVVTGLKDYLGCLVTRSNQNIKPPAYPYVSYSIITPMSENNGTYGEYEDGIARKPVTITFSFTAISDDNEESLMLANKAKEYLDYVGTVHLNDNGVIVQSTTNVTNRDNFITTEYQYRNGFDCVFWSYDEIDKSDFGQETIETVDFVED